MAAAPPKTTDEILLQRGITKELQRAIRQRIREHHLFDDRQVINAAGYLDVRNDTVRKILSPEELARFTRPDAQVDQRTVCQLIQRIMYEEKGGSMILRAAETTKAEAAENTSRGPSTAMSAKVARDQFAVANTESSDMAGFRQTALVPKNAQVNIKAVNDVAAERQAKPKPAPTPAPAAAAAAPPPPQNFEDTTQALPNDSADIMRKLGLVLETPAATDATPAPPAAAAAASSSEDINKRMEEIHPWQSLPDDFDDAPPPAPMEDGEVIASGTTSAAASAAVPMDVTPAPDTAAAAAADAPPSIAPPTVKCKPCGQEVNKLVVACPECKRETCESCVKKLVQSCTSCDTKRCLGCWTDPKKPGLNDDGQCTACNAKDNSEDQEEDNDNEEEHECVCLDDECACISCGGGNTEECDECECCQVAELTRDAIRVQRDLGYNPNNRGLINSVRQEAKDLYNKFKKEKEEHKKAKVEEQKKAAIARANASLAKMKTNPPAAAAVPPPSPSKSKAAAPPPPSPAKSKPSGNKPSGNKPIVSIVIDTSIVKPPPSPPDSDKIELAPVEDEDESSGSDAITSGTCYCTELHCPCTNCTTGEDAKKHFGKDIVLEECGECGCCKVLAVGEKVVEARKQRLKAEKKCDADGRKKAIDLIKRLKEKRTKLCAELLDKKVQAEIDRKKAAKKQEEKDEEEAERLQAELDREEAEKKKAAKKQEKKDAEEAKRLQEELDKEQEKEKKKAATAKKAPPPSSTAKAQDKKPVQAKSSSTDQDMADDDDDSAPPPPPSLSAEDQRKLKEQHERQVAAAKPKAPRRKKSNALDREFAEADEAARADAKRLGSKYDPLKELEDVRRAIVVDKTKKSKDKDRRKKMDELLKKKAEEDDDEDDDEDYGSGEDIGSGSEEEEEESTGTGGGDDEDKEGDSDEEEEEEEEEAPAASAKRKSAASSSSPSNKKARVEDQNHKHKHSDSEDDEDEEEEDEESDAVSTDDSDRSPSPAPEPRRKSVRFAAQAARESIKDQDAREEQERQDTRDSAEEEKYLLRAFRLAVEHCLDEKKSTLRHICNPNLPLSKFSQDELLSRLSFLYTVHRVYVDDPEKRAQKSNFLDRLSLAYLARVKEIGTNKNLIWALEQLLNPATTFSTHKLTELPDAPKDFWTDQKLAKMGQSCPIGGDAVKLDSLATTRLVKITVEQQQDGKPHVASVLMSSRSSAMLSRFYWACHIQDKIEEAVTAQQQSHPSMDVPNLINWICKNVGRFFVENWQKAKADLIRLIPREVYERIRDANKREWQAVLQKKRQ